jgi:hypothetical protein
MGKCMWCPEKAVTQVNVAKGRKLQLVPACPTHRDQIENAKERDAAERIKQKEQKVWW